MQYNEINTALSLKTLQAETFTKLLKTPSLNQGALNVDHKSVVDIILDQPVHCSVDIVNRNGLNLRENVVLATEVQHFLSLLDSTNAAASNPQAACNRISIT